MNKSAEADLGFIGLGMMGDPMAQNLLKAGFKLKVYDNRPEATKNTVRMGATLVQNPAGLAGCDAIFIIVMTEPQVEDVFFGKEGIMKGTINEKGLITVIMSTISPVFVRSLAKKVAARKVTVIDAPISGGPVVAAHGTLTFMVGGQKDTGEFVKPFFEAMGKNIFHLGVLGSGLAMKLVNNLISITNLFVFPEGLKIGLKAGLDMNTMLDAIRVSTANNWCSDQWDVYTGVLEMLIEDPQLNDNFNKVLIKDVQTVTELAGELGYDSPVLKALFPLIKSGADAGGVITKELFKEIMKIKSDA